MKKKLLQRILIQIAKCNLMSLIYDCLPLHCNFALIKNIHASLKCDFALQMYNYVLSNKSRVLIK